MATRRTPRSPLWAQILTDLRNRIAAGEFAQRFPGDSELVAHYGVSRHTIRDAVRRLQAEGVLVRRRGQGSFVVSAPIEQPLGTMYSLFRSVEETGAVQESVVRAIERRRDDKTEAILGCLGEPLIYLERLRLADGIPIALDSAWLPASVAEPLLEVDFRHTALYTELTERCGMRLTRGWERIRPVLPEPVQRSCLKVDAAQPVFQIERLGFDDNRPVEWRQSLVRGDRFFFVARWSTGHLDTSFEQNAGT